MSGNDFALLERWQSRRDPEAFRELVGRYAGMVYGACRRILGDASEAEDVAQECFLILACGTRPPQRHLGAWLHRVATNLSRNHVRAHARRREREQLFAAETPRDAELQWDEVADLVDEMIAALPDDLRVPLVAHFLEGQSKEAVARTLGVSRPTVSYRIDKGVGRIRARLRSRGIVIGPAALASLLAANAAEAAPATLVSALGKLAIIGAGGTVPAGALSAAGLTTVQGSGGLAGVLLSVKGVVVAATVALGIGAAWWGAAGPAPTAVRPVEPAAVVEEAADSGPGLPPAGAQATQAAPGAAPRTAGLPSSPEETSTALISGVVVDGSGRPVRVSGGATEAGLAVSLYGATSERSVSVGETGVSPDGTFAVRDAASFSEGTERVGVGARRASTGEVSEIAWFPLSAGRRRDVVLRLLPGGSISGFLADRSGRSLGRRDVDLTALDPFQIIRFESDESGAFLVGGLRPGAYELVISDLYYGTATHVELAGGQHLKDLALTIPVEHFRIAGHVRNRAGKPVPGVSLWVHSHSALCKEDGSFNETVPEEGSYLVAAFHEDFALVSRYVEANTTDVDLILGEPSGLIQGRVVDAQNQPVPQFRIDRDIQPPDRYVGGSKQYTFNNADGTFEVKVPIAGEVRLQVEAAQHEPEMVVIEDFTPPRRMAGLTVRLGDPGALSGVVRGTDGSPIADVAIVEGFPPVEPADLEARTLAHTGRDGRFTIEASKAGVESLFAYHPDYLPESAYTRYGSARSKPISLVLARSATVEGTVRRAGQPAAGVPVEVGVAPGGFEERRPTLERVTTDDEGRYRAARLMAGEVTVAVGEAGASAQERTERRAAVREGETVVVNLDLPGLTATLQGRVLVAGMPLPPAESVSVSLKHREGDQETRLRPTKLDPDGTYLFSAAPSGESLLYVSVGQVSAPGEGNHLRFREVPVRLAAQRTLTRDVDLAPADAVVEGQVLPEGDPPQRIQFRIAVDTPAGLEQLAQWEEKCQGTGFRLENLPAGGTTVSMVIHLASGKIVYHAFRCETRSGQVTHRDIVLGSGRMAVEVTNGGDFAKCAVFAMPGRLSASDIPQGAWANMQGVRFFPGGTPASCVFENLSSGSWTVFAVGDIGSDALSTLPLSELPHAVRVVEVGNDQEAQATLTIGR